MVFVLILALRSPIYIYPVFIILEKRLYSPLKAHFKYLLRLIIVVIGLTISVLLTKQNNHIIGEIYIIPTLIILLIFPAFINFKFSNSIGVLGYIIGSIFIILGLAFLLIIAYKNTIMFLYYIE